MARKRKLNVTEQLRRDAIAIRRRLTGKTYRIKNTTGIDISGSSLDIRKSAAEVKRMNASQLRSYLRQGDAFVKQRVDTVGNGKIPAAAWDKYKRVENAFNREARRRLKAFENVILPGERESIGEKNRKRAENTRMGNEAINRPIETIKRDLNNIHSLKGLDILREDLERRLKPEFYTSALESSREVAIKALIKMGEKQDVINWIEYMPDEAWDMLWNYGGFGNSLFTRYEHLMKQAVNVVEDRGYKGMGEDAESDIAETINWVRNYIESGKTEK